MLVFEQDHKNVGKRTTARFRLKREKKHKPKEVSLKFATRAF